MSLQSIRIAPSVSRYTRNFQNALHLATLDWCKEPSPSPKAYISTQMYSANTNSAASAKTISRTALKRPRHADNNISSDIVIALGHSIDVMHCAACESEGFVAATQSRNCNQSLKWPKRAVRLVESERIGNGNASDSCDIYTIYDLRYSMRRFELN